MLKVHVLKETVNVAAKTIEQRGAKSDINVSGKRGLSDLQLKQTHPASRDRPPRSPAIQVRAHKPWTPSAYLFLFWPSQTNSQLENAFLLAKQP